MRPFLCAACIAVVAGALIEAPAARADADIVSTAPVNGAQTFSGAELDQMLAPIALYPDDLLAQILMATAYPLEIVEADRWVGQNAQLRGTALRDALIAEPWDPSVKALAAFPEVLAMLDQNLGWSEELGEAFLGQRAEVAASIQRLRQRAGASGALAGTPEAQVADDGSTIAIAPTNPTVVYVPVYAPAVVYAPWPYPAYPPYDFVAATDANGAGPVYWCEPTVLVSVLWGGWDWRRHDVAINPTAFNAWNHTHLTSPLWSYHEPHRAGVAFHLPLLQARYGIGTANPRGQGAVLIETQPLRARMPPTPPQRVAAPFSAPTVVVVPQVPAAAQSNGAPASGAPTRPPGQRVEPTRPAGEAAPSAQRPRPAAASATPM